MEQFQVMFVRHGRTQYSGVFPDLTELGLAQSQSVARDVILPWLNTRGLSSHEIVVATSPAARAHGTAWEIAKEIGYRPKRLDFSPHLGPIVWRDPHRALTACRGLAGRGYVNYETEPVFADASIFETPREVRARFYSYLASVFEASVGYETARDHVPPGRTPTICVSHYETLSNLILDVFGITASESTALGYAEPIILRFSRIHLGRGSTFAVSGQFRGVEAPVRHFLTDTQDFV
jgi:broad specificity phosphatase PhoE